MKGERIAAPGCARRARWAPAAAGLLVVGAFVLLGDDAAPVKAAPAPAERAAAAAVPPQAPASSLGLERLRRQAPPRDVANLFAGHSWTPRPAVAAAPPPVELPASAAEPAAPPPLPFAYVGRFDEAGRQTVYYLERGSAVFTVAAGDAIDAEHRLDASAAGELTITHGPSQTRYVLRIPE